MAGYDDVSVDDEKLSDIHRNIDGAEEQPLLDVDNVFNDEHEQPEEISNVLTKFRVKAEISREQRKDFDGNRSFFGTHVAYSNTKRTDNLRHLMSFDLTRIYDVIPILRQEGTQVKIRETSEFQMTRGNERVGGFEAELGLVNIQRQDATVRQYAGSLVPFAKKKKFLGIFPVKDKNRPIGQPQQNMNMPQQGE